jgi:hypothetical protein
MFPALPCFPCPHASACCAFGTTLAEEEAEAIRARYGGDRIYQTRWGEWRTRVRGGRCAFLVNNGCELHNQPFYPLVCRGFPWMDSETGGPYEFDRSICPEFEHRPELVSIHPFRGRPVGQKGKAEGVS